MFMTTNSFFELATFDQMVYERGVGYLVPI